jgi:hypothetical protein
MLAKAINTLALTYLFENISKTILFGCGLPSSSLVLGIGGNSSVRIKSTDDTIGLLENLSTLFNKRLDCIDQLLLVEFFLWLSLGDIDSLFKLVLEL